MTDIEFLADLAKRLQQSQIDSPNVHFHWSDQVRLELIAEKFRSQQIQLAAANRSIELLFGKNREENQAKEALRKFGSPALGEVRIGM